VNAFIRAIFDGATPDRWRRAASALCFPWVLAAPAFAAPMVVGTNPPDGATNVSLPTTISVTFSEPLDGMQLQAQAAAGPCTGTLQLSVAADNFTTCVGLGFPQQAMNIYTATPQPALANGTLYRIRVKGSVTAGGVPMGADYTQGMGFATTGVSTCATGLTISQVYGGGGAAGSSYQTDFVELHNPSNRSLPLGGYSVQYTTAAGTVWSKIDLPSTTIPPGYYYLISLGTAGMGSPVPNPDVVDTMATPLDPTSGKVALMSTTALNSGPCPNPMAAIDFVGYGAAATCSEGTPTANISTTTAAFRGNGGCRDTASNAADFTVATPNPRGLASMQSSVCSCVANETGSASEIDFCNLQFPASFSVDTGAMTPSVYGRVYDAGITEPPGADPRISMEIGYGPANTNPQNQPGWIWFPTAYNGQFASDDEYGVSFVAPAVAGAYSYTSRASKDGINWTYCDLDGAGANPMLAFDPAKLGVMNGNPVPTPPNITSQNTVTFVPGANNMFQITATGYPAPGISVTGTLPSGVFFDPMNYTLYGTPDAMSVRGWPLVITASNMNPPNAVQNFALVVGYPQCTLDVDLDGRIDALTDGIILVRAMLGLTGSAVTAGALGPMASRNSWQAIQAYLNGHCGTSFAP
jgi:hypothetical protein